MSTVGKMGLTCPRRSPCSVLERGTAPLSPPPATGRLSRYRSSGPQSTAVHSRAALTSLGTCSTSLQHGLKHICRVTVVMCYITDRLGLNLRPSVVVQR